MPGNKDAPKKRSMFRRNKKNKEEDSQVTQNEEQKPVIQNEENVEESATVQAEAAEQKQSHDVTPLTKAHIQLPNGAVKVD